MRKITNITSIVMILGYIAFLAIGWKSFPGEVPTHFSALGVADSYGAKTSLFVEPAVMAGLFLLLAIVENFPKIWNIPVEVTEDNEEDILNACYCMFGVLKISIILICAFSGFMCIYTGFPTWPTILMVVIILLTIAISVYRIYKCS